MDDERTETTPTTAEDESDVEAHGLATEDDGDEINRRRRRQADDESVGDEFGRRRR